MNQKKILFFFALLSVFAFAGKSEAANIYVDQTLAANCTSGNYSTAARNCGGSDGDAYVNVQAALDAMAGGDDIYLRGGTYASSGDGRETFEIKADGTADDYSSIQSYPGEWARIQGSGDWCVIGLRAYQNQCPGPGCVKYWRFERLEISGGTNAGIALSGGPFTVRYCYIHDNYAGTGGDNPAGIYANVPMDSVIEYNFFDSNGASDTAGTNCAQIVFLSDYAVSYELISKTNVLADGAYNENSLIARNIVRYNLFKETTDRSTRAFKHKAGQTIIPHAVNGTITESRKHFGDKIHHNLVLGSEMIETNQDLAQIYNNIIPDSHISVGYTGDYAPLYSCIYNNYVKRLHYSLSYVTTSNKYYFWDPAGDVAFRKDWTYNNIIDNFVDSDRNRQVGFRDYMCNTGDSGCASYYDDSTVLNLNDFHFKNNYLYRPDNNNDVWNADLVAPGHRDIGLISNWETNYPQISGNYRKASSEGIDNLMSGTSGSSRYITREEHAVSGSATISNGGIGSGHPYLDDVTIPSYIGATNPDDNDWVEGVLNLADVSILQNALGDPDWIEGATTSGDEIAPASLQGLSVS